MSDIDKVVGKLKTQIINNRAGFKAPVGAVIALFVQGYLDSKGKATTKGKNFVKEYESKYGKVR